MIVVGIDPASKSLAVVSPDLEIFDKYKVKKTSRDTELAQLACALRWLSYKQDVKVFIEEPVVAGARNLRSTILIAETVGMVLSMGIPTMLVPVSSWKAGTVGNGHANKEAVAYWLNHTYPVYSDRCDGDQDLVDATCIFLYGKALAVGRRSVRS